MVSSIKKHWNRSYGVKDLTKLGWYEESPKSSLQLIDKCGFINNSRLLIVGAGTTTLIDKLLDQGFNNIIANDISNEALEKLQNRLDLNMDKVQWVVDDLTYPTILTEIAQVDLWHDRAVLHFFVKESEQNTYFKLLKKLIKPKGYVLISTFNIDGATKCSGLPVHRYDKNMLSEKLGKEFTLIESFNYTYTMPSGDTRPYVYTLFKRT